MRISRPRTRTGWAATALIGAVVLVGASVGTYLVVGSTAGSPGPSQVADASPTVAPSLPSEVPSPSPLPSASIAPSASPGSVDPLVGADGRLTILLLGSDYRPAHPGNRTDVLMVVSIDPVSGATAVVSIPRDTARFPLPSGGTFVAKVNGLYQSYISKFGVKRAGVMIERAVGGALGIQIDAYAFIGFEGVRRLVNAVGGVDVVLAHAVHDPDYWVTSHIRGVTFPAGRNHLNGDRALIFARTRKGDNDFERARRQQLLVAAAVAKVRTRGLGDLPTLIGIARTWVRSDLPLDQAPRLFSIVSNADLGHAHKAVLGPRTYATAIGSSTSFQLKLSVVRALIRAWMPPVVAPTGASASPGVGPTPGPSGSPAPSA
jgi:polyisoprenyl-teichoic acid--peptidoglycan teichoic acid transferase